MSNWNLIGHASIVEGLQAAIANGRLAHAYLLTGPPGIGKTSLAIALAQTLNCTGALPQPYPEPVEGLEGQGGALVPHTSSLAPCLACSSCRRIKAGGHPDVLTLAMEPNQRELGIDRIRELHKLAALKPYEGAQRVFILEQADHMSNEAANALLKLLEEPPAEVVLLLTSQAEEHVLPTIRSRCQALHLQRVPTPTLAAALVERFALQVPEAEALAAFAQGSPGVAIRAAGDPEATERLEEDLSRLRELLEADLPERLQAAGALLEGPESGRSNAGDVLARWELWWRDLLLVHQGCTAGLACTAEKETYQRLAGGLTVEQIHHALKAVQRARRQLDQNAVPRLVLDVLAIELPTVNPSALGARPTVN